MRPPQMAFARTLLTRLLIAFVLISVGYALGKHAARPGPGLPEPDLPEEGTTVMVYYLHATFRCATCNTIEAMTRELLESEFAEQLAAGTIRMEEVNFQENEVLARRYEVAASCVVVAHVRDGEEVAHRRLDEVWMLMKDPPAFNRYVGDVIRGSLAAGEAQP